MTFVLKPQFCFQKIEEIRVKSSFFSHRILENEYEILAQSFSLEEIQMNTSYKKIPSSRKAVLKVQCLCHPEEGIQETTIANYLRSQTGLSCCGKIQTEKKHKNRVFSEETIEKMSKSRKEYYKASGLLKTQSKECADRNLFLQWRKEVYRQDNYHCALTCIRPAKLDAHHLFSKKVFPSVQFLLENGLLLAREIHQAFHQKYGPLNIVTPFHFLDFLCSLENDEDTQVELFTKIQPRLQKTLTPKKLISNQVFLQENKGSETSTFLNINFLENIQTLYKRTEKSHLFMFQKLSKEEQLLAYRSFETPIQARFFEIKRRQ